jgi:ATP-dependent Clp protease ATP-binding subunit ClpA
MTSDVNEANDYGWTALHFACAEGHTDALRLLVDRGAVVNVKDVNGWSPLHVAAAAGHELCVRGLLANGAVNTRSSVGDTALHFAAAAGSAECVRELIMGGTVADVDARNVFGQTPKDVAMKYAKVVENGKLGRQTKMLVTAELIDQFKEEKFQLQRSLEASIRATAVSGKLAAAAPVATPRRRERPLATLAGRRAEGLAALPVDEQVRQWNVHRFDKASSIMAALHTHIAGQEIAVRAVAEAFQRRDTAGFPSDFPLVFLFCGGAGSGKLQLAKAIAAAVYSHVPHNLFVVKMDRYQRKESVVEFERDLPELLGGKSDLAHGEGPARLDGVVVFKDIDRAHPNVLRAISECFATGRVYSESHQTVITCDRSVFVMTATGDSFVAPIKDQIVRLPLSSKATNLEIESRQHAFKDGFQREARPAAERLFETTPIYARINDILPFQPYNKDELMVIATTLLQRRKRELAEAGLSLTCCPGTIEIIISRFGSKDGIRSIEDSIFEYIVEPIIDAQESGRIARGDKLSTVIEHNLRERTKRIRVKALFKMKNLPKELGNEHEFFLS